VPAIDDDARADLDDLLDQVLAGRRRALARVLTTVEDGDPERLRHVVGRLHPLGGTARILGITGSPGVGKSTLTNAVAAHLRSLDRTVGVIAVDPSSPFSGGALLGDRVRMQGHHADEGVYIRSMAARGHLGGLSLATPQAVMVLDAAGFDDVVVETVGVGQSEVEVAATADTTVVVMAPGMGDSIQAAKAGVLEVADVFAVNKADQSGAGKLESELRGMLEMGHAAGAVGGEGTWWPPIVRTVAVRGEGIPELVAAIDEHGDHLAATGRADDLRVRRAEQVVAQLVLDRVRQRVAGDGDAADALAAASRQVADRSLDPYAAADRVLDMLDHRARDGA
jgi:LAO/AO transport system kinase